MELLILGAAGETMGTAVGTSLVLLASFLTLLAVLSYYVWKPVKKIMDDRNSSSTMILTMLKKKSRS